MKSTLSNRIEALQQSVNKGEYDKSAEILSDIQREYKKEECVRSESYNILKATVELSMDNTKEAIHTAKEGLKNFLNSYELYFTLGMAFVQGKEEAKACIAFHAAYFWGRDSEDEGFLLQNFLEYKEQQEISEYEMSKALEDLIQFRISEKEYLETQKFLQWIFFSDPGQTKGMFLSEGATLYYIMIESALCEKGRLPEEVYYIENTCVRYDNFYQNIYKAYMAAKHAVRRIWFGVSDAEAFFILDVLKRYEISPELLAVITKYSVPEDFWRDIYQKLVMILAEFMPDYSEIISRFGRMAEKMTAKTQRKCYHLGKADEKISFRKVCLSDGSIAATESYLSRQTTDPNKIAIIFCSNDEEMEEECLLYLRHLIIPEQMKVEVLSVWNAKGMCYGYNRAMCETDAKYKVYIHHDSFMIMQNALIQIIDIFSHNPEWKLLGVAGSTVMKYEYRWGYYHYEEVRYNLYQDKIMDTILSRSVKTSGKVEDAKAIDGILLATAEDLPWREDVFDGWHFYDISQCYEFRKRGYRTGVINDTEPWMLHEVTRKKDPENRYEFYGKLFKKMYLEVEDCQNL